MPIKTLIDFKRIRIAANTIEKVHFSIPREKLKYWDTDRNDYVLYFGEYKLMIGSSSVDIKSQEILPIGI